MCLLRFDVLSCLKTHNRSLCAAVTSLLFCICSNGAGDRGHVGKGKYHHHYYWLVTATTIASASTY